MLQNGNCAKVFADALHLFTYYPSKHKLVATQRLVCLGHTRVMGVLPLCPLWSRDFTTAHTNSPASLQLQPWPQQSICCFCKQLIF